MLDEKFMNRVIKNGCSSSDFNMDGDSKTTIQVATETKVMISMENVIALLKKTFPEIKDMDCEPLYNEEGNLEMFCFVKTIIEAKAI